MSAWEAKLGRVPEWIGIQHEDKGHPHVHVVVAGYAEGKQVGIYERDLHWLSKTAERSKESLARALPALLTRNKSRPDGPVLTGPPDRDHAPLRAPGRTQAALVPKLTKKDGHAGEHSLFPERRGDDR